MRIIPDSEILFVTLLFLSPSMIWMTATCVKDWLNEHHNNRKDRRRSHRNKNFAGGKFNMPIEITVTVPNLTTQEIEFINERECQDVFEFLALIESLEPRKNEQREESIQ